jgi:uroporphyrin-3 C-methyltransferase
MNDSRTDRTRDGAADGATPTDAATAATTTTTPESVPESAPETAPGTTAADASADTAATPPESPPESPPEKVPADRPPPPPPPSSPSSPPPPAPKRGGALAVLALLLALAAAGGTGYLYWLWQQDRAAQETAAVRAAAATRNLDELRADLQAARERIREVEATQDERRQSVANLEEELRQVRNRLAAAAQEEASAERAPTLAETEFLLLLADRELRLAGNPRVALAALREADDRIARLDDPALAGVRAAVNDEIAAVEAVAQVDNAGIALRLDSLAGRIEGLPLRGALTPEPTAAGGNGAAPASGWDRFISRVRDAATGLFRLRRSDAPAAPLLAPDEAFFLYRNVELDLKSARLAVLAGDAANYAAGLGAARTALAEYFQDDDPAVAAVIAAIEELQQRDIAPRWPAISRSVALLRDLGNGE